MRWAVFVLQVAACAYVATDEKVDPVSDYIADDWLMANATWGTDVDIIEVPPVAISAIADAGSGDITVTVPTGHTVLENMYVRISETTSYDDEYVVVSGSVTATTFDVTATYVASETGVCDTGASGDAYMLFEDTTPTSDPRLTLQSAKHVEVQEGQPIQVTAVVQADSITAGDTVSVAVNWYNGDRVFLGAAFTSYVHNAVLSSIGVWHTISGVADAPAGARFASPRFSKNNSAFHVALDTLGLREMPHAFFAYLDTDTDYANDATIVCDEELYDYGSWYDETTGVATVPSSGIYTFQGATSGVDLLTGEWAYLNIDSSTAKNMFGSTYNADIDNDFYIITASLTRYCVAGETIDMSLKQTHGSAIQCTGDSVASYFTWFSGFKVQ